MEFLETWFSFKNWLFLIHLVLYWKLHNYQNAILMNLKSFLCAWWPTFFSFFLFFFFFFCYHNRHSIIQNLFQKINIFKTERDSSEIWDRQWRKSFSVTPVFTTLILLLHFQIIKKHQCCGFTNAVVLPNFFFLLITNNALATSWVTFLKTKILVFFWFFDLIFP